MDPVSSRQQACAGRAFGNQLTDSSGGNQVHSQAQDLSLGPYCDVWKQTKSWVCSERAGSETSPCLFCLQNSKQKMVPCRGGGSSSEPGFENKGLSGKIFWPCLPLDNLCVASSMASGLFEASIKPNTVECICIKLWLTDDSLWNLRIYWCFLTSITSIIWNCSCINEEKQVLSPGKLTPAKHMVIQHLSDPICVLPRWCDSYRCSGFGCWKHYITWGEHSTEMTGWWSIGLSYHLQ